MQPLQQQQHSRINLAELKTQIAKKIGPEGSKQYFHCLNKFLSSKLNKTDFNKLCLEILGRDNIPLHNQLVRSILKNACTAKTSPPKDDFLQHSTHVSQNGPGFRASVSPGFSNGIGLLPVSPKRARSAIRNLRSSGDRRVVLGGERKTSDVRVLENGDSGKFRDSYSVSRSEEDEPRRVSSKDHVVRDEEKEAPLEAPFGINFGSQRVSPRKFTGTSDAGSLLDSFTLREQMEQIALRHGLEGVSPECANVLNRGLDSYLKGIIRSCTEHQQIVRRRADVESANNAIAKQISYGKHVNGLKPGYSMKTMEAQENHSQCSVPLQELRVSMDLNPSLLGKEWPWLLERISAHEYEE